MSLLSHDKLEVVSTSSDVEVAKYKLEIGIPSHYSKNKRRQTMQTMKQHANFPGFRKGSIPPYILKDLDQFVLRDSCDELLEQALTELDLSKVDGDEGEPEMDIDAMFKAFKSGEDFTFTCEIQTRQKVSEADPEDLEDVVATDVEMKEVEMFKERE